MNVEALDSGRSTLDLLLPLAARWKVLAAVTLIAGAAAYGIAWIVPPSFTARTTFVPPQQSQSGAMAALSSLGGLSGLIGGGPLKSAADQYVTLLASDRIAQKLITRFDLQHVYGVSTRTDARRELEERSRMAVERKDTLVSVEVDDRDPKRAADLANAYIEELRGLSSELALTEAQQRRAFFERQMEATKRRLATAQQALQSSGFDAGALKAEPRATADAYARVRAELTAAEVRLQTLRGKLTDNAPEVLQQLSAIDALRRQLARLEHAADDANAGDYVGRYRDFKYEEALFEMFSKQYELARVDESREGAYIQVLDQATPPERRSRPKRALIAAVSALCALLLLGATLIGRHAWREAARAPGSAERVARLRAALRGR